MELVKLADVRAAAKRLEGVIQATPLEYSRALSSQCNGDVRMKCENLQRAGSFKVRGAYNRIAQLTQAEKDAGVVAASAGNHAQGVALGARLQGVEATVFMPTSAPLPKVQATEAYGAKVILEGESVYESLQVAAAYA
ncbi:MAG: threonine dehydratase, partial [Glaciecola sp.]